MTNDLSKQISYSETIEQFRDAMREQGIETKNEIIPDGSLHRIHVDGDKKGSLNGWYCLHFDERPAGVFGCNKRHGDHKFQWQAGSNSAPWTDEERKAHAERVAKERAEKDAAIKAKHEAVQAQAKALWDASPDATNDHPYLVRKGVKAHGLKVADWRKFSEKKGEEYLVSANALLVPICDNGRNIWSLQAIFPQKIEWFGNRDKDYLLDGQKRGMFHAIGKPQLHDDKPVFILAEGYATAATIHEATGHLVLACFDAGNLRVVAEAINNSMQKKGKQALIVIAADNDQWTTQPVQNPGVHYAKAAAKAVNGLLAVPPFEHSEGVQASDGSWSGPTDFNDLQQLRGREAVTAIFDAVFNPTAETVEDVPWDDPVASDIPAAPKAGDTDPLEDELVQNTYFTILGYDGPTYYLFQHEKRQVMNITKSDLSDTGLIELAPLNWWEEHFPGEKGIDKKAATNWLFRQANARGIYDPTRVRGRGAWKDKDRYVFHHGDRLSVDGVPVDITRIKSAYVYPMARRMPEPADDMLTAEEGRHLLEVAKMVRWSKPASAALLAGWTMLAPVCGALKWRPHIWLTGPAGSGKSTIQSDYACALTSGINVYAQGNSTEAGIRQELRADALPVLLDEAESNDEKERARMEAILAMIRQSSSESQAKTLKGTVSGSSMRFSIRSMFCLASINTNLGKQADADRLTKLVIRAPAKDGSGEEHWNTLSDELHKISTDETIANRLLARALALLPNILANVDVFTRAAAKFFGTQREGDQFGTMMAGAWSLCSDNVATDEQAMKMMERYDWGEHTEDHDQDDATKALESVLGAKIRMGAVGDLSVYELVRECSPAHKLDVVSIKEADASLKRHGIRVEREAGLLLFGTSVSNLKQLVEKTAYVTDLRGQLLRIPNATNFDNKPMRFNGHASKCVTIPLSQILDGEEVATDDERPI